MKKSINLSKGNDGNDDDDNQSTSPSVPAKQFELQLSNVPLSIRFSELNNALAKHNCRLTDFYYLDKENDKSANEMIVVVSSFMEWKRLARAKILKLRNNLSCPIVARTNKEKER